MKKTNNKLSTNLGNNNLPEDIKSIDFTNSAIEKLKIDDLDFGNGRYVDIPFDVPKGSHLKGLLLTISEAKKTKAFRLRFWINKKKHELNLGVYRPYKNSNDLGFTCVQVNKKQYDIYNDHTNDKGFSILC